jgi:hypothetical protein
LLERLFDLRLLFLGREGVGKGQARKPIDRHASFGTIGVVFKPVERLRISERGAVGMAPVHPVVAPCAVADRIAIAEQPHGKALVIIAPLADLLALEENRARDAVIAREKTASESRVIAWSSANSQA